MCLQNFLIWCYKWEYFRNSGVSVILYICTRTKAAYVTLIITGVFKLLVVSNKIFTSVLSQRFGIFIDGYDLYLNINGQILNVIKNLY